MLRLVEILFRPARVFAAMRVDPKWAVPFAACILLYVASTLYIINTVGIELMTLQKYQQDTRLAARVGAAKIDNAVNSSNSRIPKLIILSRLAGLAAVSLFLLAGTLTLAASALRAVPQPGYARMLSATSFSVFPFALIQFLGTVFLLSGAADYGSADLEHLISFSPARFLDLSGVSPTVVSLVQSCDLLAFAQVLFLAFGFAKVAALPFVKSLAVCLGIWAVVALGNAVFVSMF